MVEIQVHDFQASGSPPSPNPDMQGYVVRLSGFITHLGVAVLMSWSNKSPRHYYSAILAQMAFIVLGTLIRSNYLSIVDINFAIIQTRSPVCVYIFLLVIPRLLLQSNTWKKEEKAQKQAQTSKAVLSSLQPFHSNLKHRQDRIVAGLVILVSLVLNLIRQFHPNMFSGSTSEGLLADFFPGGLGTRQICIWLALALCSAGTYSLVLQRHGLVRRNLMHQLAGSRKIKFKSFSLRRQILWGFCATWFTVMKLHPWLPFLYAAILFINWSFEMDIWSVEANYSLTFGQFLAIAPAFFILYHCIGLFISRRYEIASLPHRFVLDIIWLISGEGKPGWTAPRLELILKNAWDTFPSDLPQEAVELPITSQPGDSNVAQRRSSNVKVNLASRRVKVRCTKESDIGKARPPYSQYII